MSGPRKVYFVCSSALHVKLFASTIRRVASGGRLQPNIVSLDRFYAGIHGNVIACAEGLQLPAVIRDAGFGRGGGLMARICAAHGAGMRATVALLNDGGAGLVVLGNDTGHAERVFIAAARSVGVPTLLVQDGFLFDQFPAGLSGSLRLRLRQFWLALGGNRLGWVPYGMGGCDAIAAHGIGWLQAIHRGKRAVTKHIVVTGHPALIKSDAPLAPPLVGSQVLFFCSNFLSAYNDAAAHRDQICEILALHKLLMARYGSSCVLHVKLHPADQLEDYAALTGISGITLHKDAVLDELIRKSWLCVTNISSVSLDCLVNRRICLMSGISLKSVSYRRLFAQLPGTKCVTWNDFSGWLDLLDSADGYARVLTLQEEELETWIGEPGQGGARLAGLIDELASANVSKGNP